MEPESLHGRRYGGGTNSLRPKMTAVPLRSLASSSTLLPLRRPKVLEVLDFIPVLVELDVTYSALVARLSCHVMGCSRSER